MSVFLNNVFVDCNASFLLRGRKDYSDLRFPFIGKICLNQAEGLNKLFACERSAPVYLATS